MSTSDILKTINTAATTCETTIVDMLAQPHKDIDDNDWDNILLTASMALHISVETLLEKIEYRNSYDYFLENEAEKQYRQMMSAENVVTGCEPDDII